MITTILKQLCLYIVTWNVSSKYPDASPLTNLLGLEKNPENDNHQPDFYVIGLQEINAQPQNMVLGFFKDDPWTQRFKEILKERDYVAVKSEQMQGMLLILFAKRKHILHLRQIETEYTRTGLGGMWGNKGAISIRLSLYGTAVSIVNAHLAAHDHMLDERIVDFNQILDNHHYHVKMYREIFDHDYVFWFGDLNFRLNGENETTPQDIRAMIQKDKLSELLDRDQLNSVRKEGRAFYQLNERLPAFPPTFKFERGTSNYDMKRRPAWCDRILYKVRADAYQNVQLSIEQTSYKSHPGYTISDHKPVTSEFVIKVVEKPQHEQPTANRFIGIRSFRSMEPVDFGDGVQHQMMHNELYPDSENSIPVQVFEDPAEKSIEFAYIPSWHIGEDNSILYTIPEGFEENDGTDWIAIYRSDFSSFSEYVGYEYTARVDEKKSPRTKNRNVRRSLRLEFSENIDLTDGESYILLYFQSTGLKGVTGMAGMSNVFRAEKRPPSPRFEAVD
ncbi:inositol polyphosphate 5-phosphatase K isoform X2 [Hermetia illucens]|uniref:inositol polyphosphate 5-phosphatase K isoform X2 n=1 Tax=Hermetia illucens TaxID=343691 RepID=UPI0018CC7B86|nr:inositol polyphosphate 5-phosphatase K isoform X2 [Hermetia illucens]